MSFQRTDFLELNRGGTPGAANGLTGTYYVDRITSLENVIGIPLLSQLGGVPVSPGPHAYIDDTVAVDALYIWDQSANAYVTPDDTVVSLAYVPATRVLTVATTHATFTVTLPQATSAVDGLVKLAQAASYPQPANDTAAVTPAYLAAALLASPSDKYVNGLSSYNAATNILTLSMSDGSTVPLDMTALIADAITGLALSAITITGGGLATGGGDLTANRVITVTASSNAQAIAGTDTTTAMTPASTAAALANAIASLVPNTRSVTGTGLATGGGPLNANQAINVQASSNAQAVAGTDTSTAMTPASTLAAINAHPYMWMAAPLAP